MNEKDKQALKVFKDSKADNVISQHELWQAALEYARGQQEPVAVYMEHRWIRNNSKEFWGLCEKPLAKGTKLYTTPPAAQPVRLTDEEIEKLRHKTFSTNNPFCPCDSKTMRKAANAIMDAMIKKNGGSNE